jgi:hypothetical protein
MHAVAARNISDETVRARLLDDIGRNRALTANASAAGVRVHTLPTRTKDIEDDGAFHYAVLGPGCASESGKPNEEAKRFLDETTGPDRPRVYRNAVILLAPSRDGLELATGRVRDYLAWEVVRDEIKKQQSDGNVDPARALTLQINIDKAKGRIPESIKQAYCIVVTVSERKEAVAFKISVTEDPQFNIIKSDKRSRLQDTPITAEALLPDGPYNLWRSGETSQRVKVLAGAFAQFPHLPKMLKTSAILDTLVNGCENGTFVLRLTRPDGTSRTWWMSRPDDYAISDPALELVLPEAAELREISPSLLAFGMLPGLWASEEITVKAVTDYFNGTTIVQVEREGYEEPVQIPKAAFSVVEKAIQGGVEGGTLWLISGPASILAEPVPAGVLSPSAKLCAPPAPIAPAQILPENLPSAWRSEAASALSIATALSVNVGKTLPWKTVRDAISGALQARFLELTPDSHEWPCDFPSSKFVTLRVPESLPPELPPIAEGFLVAEADLEPAQIQDLGDIVPKLLEIKARTNSPLRFHVRIEMGDAETQPPDDAVKDVNALLKDVKESWQLR